MNNNVTYIENDNESQRLKNLLCCRSMSEIEEKGLLSELELYELFEVRKNPNFSIEDYFTFDRKMDLWPEISILGSRLYRGSEKEAAYEMFSKINNLELGTKIPTWSQGIYGMNLTPDAEKNLSVSNAKFVPIDRRKSMYCVSFDKNYISYAKIYARQAQRLGLSVSMIFCYSDENEVNEILEELSLYSVNLYVTKTPSGMDIRNKKGFFTLARYILAKILLKNNIQSIVITDIDAVIKTPDSLKLISDEYDVSCLTLDKWGRPWLKNTAPFLMIRGTENGHILINHIVDNINSKIIELCEGSEISLWGVDQAAITSAIDYLKTISSSFSEHNFIKNIKQFMEQAQEYGTKAEFIKKNNVI